MQVGGVISKDGSKGFVQCDTYRLEPDMHHYYNQQRYLSRWYKYVGRSCIGLVSK